MSIIGIDLGTSNSLASVWREGGVTLIPNVMGTVFTPSVVSMDDDGSLLVGHAARERLVAAPERTVAAFKRDMGTDRTYALGGRAFTPEELSSLVLRRLKEDAEIFLGEPVQEAVISVPAYFDDRQRAATRRAGLLAGLHVERLVTEPSAAALTCRMGNHSDDFTAMVFDFGGGTLDVSIVDCFENVISVLALAGDNRLGGNDFDLALARAFCEANGHRFDSLRPQARTALLFAAEAAKRSLTTSDAYCSLHGNTAKAAQALADIIKEKSDVKVSIADIARDDLHECVEDAFRYDRMVLCAPTYDGGIMPIMEDFINHLRIKTYQNRKVAFVENGTWAPAAGKKMREQMEAMKNITIIEPIVTVESTVKAKTIEDLKVLADALLV